MDDRRRTISSEEQMIGEALMRVSNTLEAQRLTKSLDYQEKIRRRSKIRLVIAILCLLTALMMVGVGGALLLVLWKYADPVLGTLMPFLTKVFGDFGIIWDGLVESATYMPVMVEQLTRILESMCVMLEGISSIDLAGMMKYLTGMLGTMSGMVNGLKPMMDAMGGALINMMQGLASGDFSAINDMLAGLGLDGMMQSMGSLMKSMSSIMGSLAQGLGKADMNALSDATAGLVNGMSGAMQAMGDSISPAQINKMMTDLGSAMQGMVAGLKNIGDLLGKIGQ